LYANWSLNAVAWEGVACRRPRLVANEDFRATLRRYGQVEQLHSVPRLAERILDLLQRFTL
jgi:hypothetical protein